MYASFYSLFCILTYLFMLVPSLEENYQRFLSALVPLVPFLHFVRHFKKILINFRTVYVTRTVTRYRTETDTKRQCCSGYQQDGTACKRMFLFFRFYLRLGQVPVLPRSINGYLVHCYVCYLWLHSALSN